MRPYCMKPIYFLTILTLAALLCSGGCDMFRKIAGRPVSSEIEAVKAAAEAEKAAARKADSLAIVAARKARADSAAAVKLLDSLKVNVIHSSAMGGAISDVRIPAYHIVVGSFKNMDNAGTLLEKVLASGYPASILRLGNGYAAVIVCPSDRISDIADAYVRVSRESFCPRGAWILNNSDKTL